ncbi:PBP1A family penicillin-binding protein [Bacillaceae bacterium]
MPNENAPERKMRKRSGWRIFFQALQWLALLFLLGLFFAGGALAGFVASLVKDQPVRSYEELHRQIFTNYLTGFAYFNDNSLIGQLRAEQDRRLVKLDEVPDHFIKAIIATEDKEFASHHGVVPKAILRAAIQQVTDAPVQTGGSTLTQQLVKNTVLQQLWQKERLGDVSSFKRKAAEIFLALRVERMFSKEQILEAYINEIYFGKNANGSNVYGVQAAAKGIFGVNAKDLNLAQAAYLAGIPQSPITYSPFTAAGFKAGKKRQEIVLQRMLESGFIDRRQYEKALAYDLQGGLAKPTKGAYSKYPFLMMEIEQRAAEVLLAQELAKNGKSKEQIPLPEYRQMLEDKRKEILRNGYHIYTTIDKKIHEAMQEIASDPKNFGPNATYRIQRANGKVETIKNALEEVGATLIDNETGAILGMIGGRDFNVEQTNHTQRPRQPGSAMKPLAAYAPAFELGKLQPGSVIDDSPIVLKDGRFGEFTPQNWDFKFHGLITAREALKWSYNIPAIKTYVDLVGIEKALAFVKKMGVTTLVDADYHAQTGVIGGLTYGLTVEEITNAYATFPNGGMFVDAYLIREIKDSEGNMIYRHTPQPKRVFSEQTAYLMTDMMRTVVNEGTGTAVRRYVGGKRDIAGKTGTTNDTRDLWFVGYTPRLTLGVWIGYDEPYPLPRQSNRRPQEIWGKVMTKVWELYPDKYPESERFKVPDGIVRVNICAKSGKLPTELCEKAGSVITEIFNQRWVPRERDDVHVEARVIQLDDKIYLAKPETPDDMILQKRIFIKREARVFPRHSGQPGRSYFPGDWEQTLPAQTDPRSDDGQAPAPPQGLQLSRHGNTVTLSWRNSPERDVVGYRIYRATNGTSPLQKIGVVLQHERKTFIDPGGAAGDYAYYVTAVDVAGKESSPAPTATVHPEVRKDERGAHPTNPPQENSAPEGTRQQPGGANQPAEPSPPSPGAGETRG